jgi:hypothetical protein
MKQIKIPTTIMDVYCEAEACFQLSKEHDSGWLPSPKAVMYKVKARKLYRFADRAMQAAFSEIKALTDWTVNMDTGMIAKAGDPEEVVTPKKARKPRAVPVTTDIPKQ